MACLLGGCAFGPHFELEPQSQVAAEEWSLVDHMDGKGRWKTTPFQGRSEWAGAACAWSWTWDVAACNTYSRLRSGGEWVRSKRRYKQWSDGSWELLPP